MREVLEPMNHKLMRTHLLPLTPTGPSPLASAWKCLPAKICTLYVLTVIHLPFKKKKNLGGLSDERKTVKFFFKKT